MKTVLIFGAFDGIHDGHREFIKQANTKGDQLVAILARDSVVEKLKNKMPMYREDDRTNMLLTVPEIDRVYLGDKGEGEYKVLKEINPDIIYLGYDQEALYANIKEAIEKGILSSSIELIFGKPYKPDTHHSSILNPPNGIAN